MAVSFQKFNSFVAAVANGVHNLSTATLKVALTAAANAPVATNTQLSNLTEISYTNLSTRTLTTTSSTQTGGLYSLILQDLVLTASGGSVAAFQYVVIYNDSATNKELIGFYSYGSALTLANGETLTIDLDQVNGVINLQ